MTKIIVLSGSPIMVCLFYLILAILFLDICYVLTTDLFYDIITSAKLVVHLKKNNNQ